MTQTRNIRLLDCTLRDGGYLNDWKFNENNISCIFERLVASGVDVIEVGFLDDRRCFDTERTIMPDTASVEKIFGCMNRGKAMIVGMIDFGTCAIENVQPCAESYLDGIRVIFKKDKMYPAMAFCKQLKELGYKVFSQLVSVTSYTDEELREVIGLVNDCHPFAVSMVDTYGLCDSVKLTHMIQIIDENLAPDICLGYHSHNNFQLGYANAVSVLNYPMQRDVLVDGTLYGMGKSAGNAPLELLAMYMNLNFGKQYDLGQIQEAISTCVLDLYHKKPWGYTLFYFIAASNRCHPDYVSWLMNKRTLSITGVNAILKRLPEEDKLGKNMKLIEKLYLEYQSRECDDAQALAGLKKQLAGKPVLMIGPGRNAMIQQKLVLEHIEQNHPIVISINHYPKGIPADYLFLTNSRRHLQLNSEMTRPENQQIGVIATSNISDTENTFRYTVNFSSLIDESAEFPDNSMMMLVRLLVSVGVTEIALAGFDGYSVDDVNYFDANMEYSFVKQKAIMLNESGENFFKAMSDRAHFQFVTRSYYQMKR